MAARNTKTLATAYVALGSNLGDRERTLERAVEALARIPRTRVVRASRWIETAPVGGPPDQGRFLNGAAMLETELAPRELLDALLAIERDAGRVRRAGETNAPRTLDLDLLLHGGERVDEAELRVPHPRLEERLFVLEPLAEIAPDLRLPSGTSIAARIDALKRRAPIVRLDDPRAASAWCDRWRASGKTLGFVPTMGALHAGHLALVARALAENDGACVSVFVNPLQFNDPRDFERYPRDLDGDARMLGAAGCTMVFTGTLAQFFACELDAKGELVASAWREPGPRALGLEGDLRPGHFRGVATIVARLFDVVRPTRAYFGAKDYQQTLVVADLAEERGGPELVVVDTEREPSGLARSSRNELLSPADRARAVVLHRSLEAARDAWRAGERDATKLSAAMRATLATDPGVQVEYAEVRDPERWTRAAPTGTVERAVALVAARVGGVRLIDNARLDDRRGRRA